MQLRLIVLLERIDWSHVRAEQAKVPFVTIEIVQRNAGVVLHNRAAVIENEIPDRAEALLKQEVGRRLEDAHAHGEVLTKIQEAGIGSDSAIGNVGRKIEHGLGAARGIVGIGDLYAGRSAVLVPIIFLESAVAGERD